MPPIINPIRKTDKALRRYLLNITPIGVSVEDVMRIAEDKNRWVIRVVNEDFGVVIGTRHMDPLRGVSPDTDRDIIVIGQHAVEVHLGTYYALGVVRTDVTVFFAFDENEEFNRRSSTDTIRRWKRSTLKLQCTVLTRRNRRLAWYY